MCKYFPFIDKATLNKFASLQQTISIWIYYILCSNEENLVFYFKKCPSKYLDRIYDFRINSIPLQNWWKQAEQRLHIPCSAEKNQFSMVIFK